MSKEENIQLNVRRIESLDNEIQKHKTEIKDLQDKNKIISKLKKDIFIKLGNILMEEDCQERLKKDCSVYFSSMCLVTDFIEQLQKFEWIVLDFDKCSNIYFTSLILKKIPVFVYNYQNDDVFEIICQNNKVDYKTI